MKTSKTINSDNDFFYLIVITAFSSICTFMLLDLAGVSLEEGVSEKQFLFMVYYMIKFALIAY